MSDNPADHTHTYSELRRDAEIAYHQMLARCGEEIDPDLVIHSGMFFAEVRKMLEVVQAVAETDSTRYLDNQGVMECPFCDGKFLGWGSRQEHILHEKECIVRSARALLAVIDEASEEEEEREWDAIVSQPRLQEVGRRMAGEARRAYEAGETEEGGFDGL
jgi:hypothetical protein